MYIMSLKVLIILYHLNMKLKTLRNILCRKMKLLSQKNLEMFQLESTMSVLDFNKFLYF